MDNFINSLSLLQELDKKLFVLLRDGKTLIGYLRSIDQFANLVLHRTIERIHVGNKYGDIERGIFIIRGENVALCGEIDQEGEERINKDLTQVSVDEILEAQQNEMEEKLEKKKLRQLAFQKYGFFPTEGNEDI